MSLLGHTENHEISLPLDFDAAFSLINSAAEIFGEVTDTNKMMGLVRFKKGMGFTRNAVKFDATFINQGKRQT